MSKAEFGISYQGIIPIFLEPEFKSQLTSKIRYDRYRMSKSPYEYARLLGPDVRFVSHPGVTYNITKRFVNAQNESKENKLIKPIEARMLLTAALIHDWGELKIENLGHGDVTFEEHDKSYEEKERIIFEKITEKIPNHSDKVALRLIYDQVVQSGDKKLGEMFNAIERIGYLNTGLRAYIGRNDNRIENWAGLTGNVLSNQITALLNYSSKFPYVSEVLSKNSDLINEAFEKISQMEISPDNRGEPSFDLEKFQYNHRIWKKSLFSS